MKRCHHQSGPVAADAAAKVLPAGRTVVVELDRLVCVVACGLGPGRRVVSCFGCGRCRKHHCENTLSDVVVESVSIVRSMSICSINVSASRVVYSKVNASPSVVRSHVVLAPVMSAALGVTFSPDHEDISDP